MTLHQWQRLATPHLGCFMDLRPGVQSKGERPLQVDEEIYNLSDIEEDTPGTFDSSLPLQVSDLHHDLRDLDSEEEIYLSEPESERASHDKMHESQEFSHPASIHDFTRRRNVRPNVCVIS